MANTDEPLLGSPTGRIRPVCRVLLVSLSLVSVVCLTSLITLQFTTTRDHQLHLPQPSDLCASSPHPTSCHTIVSEALLAAGASPPHPATSHILHSIVGKSMLRLDAAVSAAGDVHRQTNEPGRQAAVADCLHLMDLSRDYLSNSVSTVNSGELHAASALTWLSAALTNYDTCLDGLDGAAATPRPPALEAHLKGLMELASAALAVLNAGKSAASAAQDDEIISPVFEFPSWLPARDRKLLQASPGSGGIQANVVVAADGSGNYKTVQAAVDSAPDKGKSRYVIYVKKGTYKENVSVGKAKTNVMIVGDGMDATIVTGSLNVVDGSTTFNSATLAAVGTGFILQDLSIQNTAGPEKHQAVALRVGADQSVINRCKLEGYQDTLYPHSLRQFYRDSVVSGTVDYIFGNAAVVLQNCKLVARRPMSNQKNLVTAQGRTDPNQNTGTSVQNCQVVPGADLVPVKASIPTYLGRPWKEYSRTVFMQSYIDNHVAPKGWLEWSGDFALKTLWYGEYANTGPGAGTGGRVTWPGYHVITDPKVASGFTVASLIQGGVWLKNTGVTYTEGL